ncbi:retrotransposable element Tf2 [Tanacetum coccineum]
MALEKLRGYLLDRHFKIKTDHFSLKYLMGQRLTTPFQTKWLPKLLGFDYEISYKSGSKNVVANALSRISSGAELNELVLTSITTDLMQQMLWEVIQEAVLLSIGKQKLVKQAVKECDVCQREKPDISAYLGLLQPLPIPEKIWSSISMDFIEKLPSSHGKTVLKVQHKMSIAYRPQTDGQTEIVNKCLECFLRCMTWERPKEWTLWLPMAEFCLVEVVDRTMQAREEFLQVAKFHLKRAQDRMVSQANKHRSDKVFKARMWVYLKLQPHRQVTLRKEHQHKLSSKYFGPFMILEKIEAVAYKLELPQNSQVHPVFHIFQLKLCQGNSHKTGTLPHCEPNGVLSAEPVAILDRRLAKVNNKSAAYVLVKWSNHTNEDATWENYVDLIQRYPEFEKHA